MPASEGSGTSYTRLDKRVGAVLFCTKWYRLEQTMADAPNTKILKASDARSQWSQVLNQVFRRESRVIVEKSGIPVAAIISAEDLAELTRLEQQREEDFKALDATRAAFADVPDEELEREIAKALASVRGRRRAQEQRPQRG